MKIAKRGYQGSPLLRAGNTGSDPLLLTVPEAARLLHLGRNSVYELVACRQLPALHFGRAIRIPRASLEAWVERAALDNGDVDAGPWLSPKPPSAYRH
jgi:excisionase family DNA binding protein